MRLLAQTAQRARPRCERVEIKDDKSYDPHADIAPWGKLSEHGGLRSDRDAPRLPPGVTLLSV